MKNLTLENIAAAIEGELHCDNQYKNRVIKGAVIDSRLVEEDYLFFAVKGNKVDGHDFIDKVYDNKALVVVTEKELETNKPYILVNSSLEALKKLASYYRKQLDIPVIGISGSVGKTSTKEFISSVLSMKYNVLKTEGNFNNEIGLPLTVLRIREQHEVAVLEMGISDFGEMSRLAQIAIPDVCVLTNIGICHLENLFDRDGVLKAKTEMFEFASKDCTVIINGDDDKLSTINCVNGKKPLFYGKNNIYSCYCDNVLSNGVLGTECDIFINNEMIHVNISIPGIHMIYNAMAAALCGNVLDVSNQLICEGIEKLKDAAGRVNIIRKEYTIIDDCYNANPISMKASLDLLATAKDRKIACLGDMFELGENKEDLHYDIGKYIASKKIDVVFLCGELSKNIEKGILSIDENIEVFWYNNIIELMVEIKKYLKPDDTILVKASHGMEYVKIVDFIK